MADVFVSYAQEDRALAADLAHKVEAHGYSAWWDYALVGGVRYRQEILNQLNLARAVIVIWSPRSVQSHFVEDEAERARLAGKLIPVRTKDLTVAHIPLGFGGYQTLELGDLDAIVKALSALGLSATSPRPVLETVRLVKLGREVVEAVQDGFGRSIARSGKPSPSTADIVAANPKPIADTVLAIHKEVWSERTLVFGVPLANRQKNLLWPHLREMLTNPLAHFGDKKLFSEHVAWWEKHGSAVVKVVNTGRLHGEAEGHDEERPADPERVKDLLRRYEALKADEINDADPEADDDDEPPCNMFTFRPEADHGVVEGIVHDVVTAGGRKGEAILVGQLGEIPGIEYRTVPSGHEKYVVWVDRDAEPVQDEHLRSYIAGAVEERRIAGVGARYTLTEPTPGSGVIVRVDTGRWSDVEVVENHGSAGLWTSKNKSGVLLAGEHIGHVLLERRSALWQVPNGCSLLVKGCTPGRLFRLAAENDTVRAHPAPASYQAIWDGLLARLADGSQSRLREPRATEVRLANCVSRYVQEWLKDAELAKLLKGHPPTMEQLLSPPKDARIAVGRWVKDDWREETVTARVELKKCMGELYADYADHPEMAKDGAHPCILPLINPDVRTNPAVTTLREVASNLHRAFEPAAAPIKVAVRVVQGKPAGQPTQRAGRETGTVQSFDLIKGYGFITPDGGGKDIVVDMEAVKEAKIGPLEEGMRVSFEHEPDNRGRGRRAVRIRPV